MILLDTHVLVWALEDDARLGPMARAALDRASAAGAVHIAAITPWEIALLVQKGRLALTEDVGAWLDAVLALPALRLAPLEPAIAVDSVRLPEALHPDPADRLIIATARHLRVPLLTADRAILDYGAAGHVAVLDAAR
ncbi:type II toxin-antitoxin system VapC family toxin [Ancylobacter sp. SL191]|uniref:type II toxin-antitoxin system VapC family toxin n=1 Tax=Ancylobacter sp. SL191 TaxID=2995166 RepID=UPI00226DF46F|nr:type II toxin-antitoxin system VapC family toxin [Ancylobacter sp. SL191]WAC27215.1 type II toxin-antitoxin system VapC family toxin [Ancylobacter sp. SL191]